MTYWGTTIEGLEAAAEKETKGKKVLPGRVEFSNNPEKDYRTLDTIYEKIHTDTFTSLENLRKKAEKIILPNKESFSCECIRKGEHKFNSVNAKEEVGKVLQKNGYTYDPKQPQQTLILDIVDNHFTIGKLIEKRPQKKTLQDTTPQSNNPTFTRSMRHQVTQHTTK